MNNRPWIIFRLVALSLLAVAAVYICLKMNYWADSDPQIAALPPSSYADTLVVVADMDYQPYSFTDNNGTPSGYDVELIYHLADAMHKNVEIRLMRWTDAQRALQSGEADVLMGLDYNLDNLNEFELSLPLDNDPFVAFGKKPLSSVEELNRNRLATLEGSGSFPAFLTPYQLEKHTKVYPSYSEAFQSILDGENDYAVAMYSVGRRVIANLGDYSLKAVGPTLAGNYLCIGTRKGNTVLMGELNSAITCLKREGVIDELGMKWLGRYVEVISIWDFIEKNLLFLTVTVSVFILAIAVVFAVFNRRLAKSACMQHEMTKKVLEYQRLITEATKGLYESIYELDITHNCAGDETTRQYFESLGIPGDSPVDQALRTIADKQIRPEFIRGYLDTFEPEHIEKAYHSGVDNLSYDFMISHDGENYYWMRIVARIFHWMEDDSLRMIVYRQNIDAEMKKEQDLREKMRQDPLTGLYNKTTTEQLIRQELLRNPQGRYVFVMLDIDCFKAVNDSLGHAFGDYVIVEFARGLKKQTEEKDIVGRIGGDEFVVFGELSAAVQVEEKALVVLRSLCRVIQVDEKSCNISASIGIALYPQDGGSFEALYRQADAALYYTKKNGRNGYTLAGNLPAQE